MASAAQECLSDPENSASECSTPRSVDGLPPIITPPYWQHQRSTSSNSHVSVDKFGRATPIHLEDHTENESETAKALWARGVIIEDYRVVQAGANGIGAYVVWNCRVETLELKKLTTPEHLDEVPVQLVDTVSNFPRSRLANISASLSHPADGNHKKHQRSTNVSKQGTMLGIVTVQHMSGLCFATRKYRVARLPSYAMGPRANSPARRPHLRSSAAEPSSDRQLRTKPSTKRAQDHSDSDGPNQSKRRKGDKPSHKQVRIPLRSREPDVSLPEPEVPRPIPARPVTGSLRKSRRPLPPIHISPLLNTQGIPGEVNQEQKEPRSFPKLKDSIQQEKRALRSHDGGSRSRTELATYFHNYEQMISLEPVAPEFLTPISNITLFDDLQPSYLQDAVAKSLNRTPAIVPKLSDYGGKDADNSLIFQGWDHLHNVQRIDLNVPPQNARRFTKDPLSSDLFASAHRRPERQEKQLRNIEKERAQHEKVQLDRLLGELKGPDWLRVMGISGITETEKKLYEPKRVLFVKEVAGMIDKFKHWKEEEKRRKIESQLALLTEDEEAELEANGEEDQSSVPESPAEEHHPPDSNELDAWAARQLHQEAHSASKASTRRKLAKPPGPSPVPLPPPPPLSPIKSFYSKKHLRDAAVGKGNLRRGGRMLTAFGVPLPEMEEKEFDLTSDILNANTIRASARNRRARRRDRPED
ncbi:MAG: hypothetical protein Q9227_002389 [Pyrenula ochraceoflavens]